MIQLWLGGKRIDSIPMLREEFASRDEDGKITLCSELLKKIADGFFIPWLEFCPETRRRANDRERRQDASLGIWLLEEYREKLQTERQGEFLSAEAKDAVAKICDIDIGIVEKSGRKKVPSFSRDNLIAQLEGQEWYRDAEVRRTIAGIAMDRLATDSSSLERIIGNAIRQSQRRFTDLYLLNTGNRFIIGNLNNLINLRLVGFGNPEVHFAARLRGDVLDMTAHNIEFKGFSLMSNGVKLINRQGRLVDVVRN